MRGCSRNTAALLALTVGLFACSLREGPGAADPDPGRFDGHIGDSLQASTAAWPPARRPPEGAPNVLVWVIDDAGFAQLGSFGGPIETPHLDELAEQGLRYSNFHVTPVCSATRAALLTGRNPHRVHVGAHAGAALGFPGYDAHIPPEAGTIAAALRQQGYLTWALGKWDHLPSEDASPAGPFDYWPSGQGFERFYGFLAADTDNFRPNLWSDHAPVEIPADREGYHLSADLADRAIRWIGERRVQSPPRPFFLYWATGAVHAPHHAPARDLEHYRGRFDAGWDVAREQILARQKQLGVVPADAELPPRPDGMPAWDSLGEDEKRSYARAMEAFAAQLTHADRHFGRILEFLRQTGELDNTLVMVLSDNGASAEGAVHGSYSEHLFFNGRFPSVAANLRHYETWGGPDTYPHYPVGWAVAGNTPFRYYKQTAYEGGTRVPLIVSWPRGIAQRGEVRGQYHFVTDLAPTILAAASLEAPDEIDGVGQMSFDGIDLSYSFESAQRADRRRVQYYEMHGNRSIYRNGWKAVNRHRTRTWELPEELRIRDDTWELYHLESDPGELRDRAEQEPERLRRLLRSFDRQARANHVHPMIPSPGLVRPFRAAQAEAELRERGGLFVYRGPVRRIPSAAGPPLLGPSFRLAADLRLGDGEPASGPVLAYGGGIGGMSLFLAQGRPVFVFKDVDLRVTRIEAAKPLGAGPARVELDFRRGAQGAHVVLSANGEIVGDAEVPAPLPWMFSLHETIDIGSDTGSPVVKDYASAPEFSGEIDELRVQVLPGDASGMPN